MRSRQDGVHVLSHLVEERIAFFPPIAQMTECKAGKAHVGFQEWFE